MKCGCATRVSAGYRLPACPNYCPRFAIREVADCATRASAAGKKRADDRNAVRAARGRDKKVTRYQDPSIYPARRWRGTSLFSYVKAASGDLVFVGLVAFASQELARHPVGSCH